MIGDFLPRSRAWLLSLRGKVAAVAILLALPLSGGCSSAVGEASTDVYGDYLSGLYAAGEDDFAAAANFLNRVLAQSPAETSVQSAAFAANLRNGNIAPAAEIAQTAPDSAPLAGLLPALQALHEGDFAETNKRLAAIPAESWLQKDLVPLTKAWSHTGAGRREEALAALTPIAENLPELAAVMTGMILEHFGEPQAAEAAYRMNGQNLPELPELNLRALARLKAETGARDTAQQLLSQYLQQKGNSVTVKRDLDLLARGRIPPPIANNVQSGLAEAIYQISTIFPDHLWRNALELTQLAIWLNPRLEKAKLLAAVLLERHGIHQAAIETYNAIPPDSPWAAPARRGAASSLQSSGQSEKAIILLEEMLRENPQDIDALRLLGLLYNWEKRYPEMEQIFTRLIPLATAANKKDLWFYHYRLGVALERQQRYPEAEEQFLQALQLNPDEAEVLNYLGYVWVDQGRNLERGLEMLKKAVDISQNGHIIDSLGWAYYRIGAYPKAVEMLERSAQLEPSIALIFDHLGDAYWEVGRFREARFQWLRALSSPNQEDFDPGQTERKLTRECPRACGKWAPPA